MFIIAQLSTQPFVYLNILTEGNSYFYLLGLGRDVAKVFNRQESRNDRIV